MSDDPSNIRTRLRTTRRRVRFFDSLSKSVITVGGIGTIFAVATVCVFLLVVSLPLFMSGDITDEKKVAADTQGAAIRVTGSDEHRLMSWDIDDNGVFKIYGFAGGQLLSQKKLTTSKPSSFSFNRLNQTLSLGFDNGEIVTARFKAKLKFFEKNDPFIRDKLPEGDNVEPLKWKEVETNDDDEEVETEYTGVFHRTPSGQYRAKSIEFVVENKAKVCDGPVVHLNHVLDSDNQFKVLVISTKDNKTQAQVVHVSQTLDMLTDALKTVIKSTEAVELKTQPQYAILTSDARQALMVFDGGQCCRYKNTEGKLALVEQITLLKEKNQEVTCFKAILGEETILVGGSKGALETYFLTMSEKNSGTKDNFNLTMSNELSTGTEAIKKIALSSRTRIAAILNTVGDIAVYQITSQNRIADVSTGNKEIEAISLTPKNDSLIARDRKGFYHWVLDVKYPEAGFGTLFTKVHYEGYKEPKHMWQSSSGTDESEAKLGLFPLIFGTLKATFYSLIFGAPLALLAALFTSEFLHESIRRKIKPLIEIMASLPSVVLGFLAALYFAPIVEKNLASVLACVCTVPLAFMAGGCGWQFLSVRKKNKLDKYRFPYYLLICLPIGLILGFFFLGNLMESIFFLGDLKTYLHGHRQEPAVGHPMGGWMILLLPLSMIFSFMLTYRFLEPVIKNKFHCETMIQAAILDVCRFLFTVVMALAIAAGLSFVVGLMLDSRGDGMMLDTFVQRNALVVGFIMGFSVIPIIYSIAEDALTAVPAHLRAASYGAGATRWQTAMRIVIPTAMSGLFSACMVGLGRAVGETMIVLMAAGNTPIMEINIFNGFRTLSANIAVELPEAVQGSTHYRVLFLAALVLFALTFVLNTVAELIRMKFRKKAHQL